MERLVTDMTETQILFDLLEKEFLRHMQWVHVKKTDRCRFWSGWLRYGMELKSGRKICGKSSWNDIVCIHITAELEWQRACDPHCSSTYRFPMLKDQTVLRYSDKRIRTGECGSLRRRNLKYMARPSTRCSRKSCSAQWGCVYTESGHVPVWKNIMTIPNLAIHMNREVNKGVELNKQTELLPICGLSDDADYFLDFLAKELAVKKRIFLILNWPFTIKKSRSLWD